MYLPPYDIRGQRRTDHIVQKQQRYQWRTQNIEQALLRQGFRTKGGFDCAVPNPAFRDREAENDAPKKRVMPRQKEECGIEDCVPDEGNPPQSRVVDAGDDDLPCREFEKLVPTTFTIGRDQALRNKDDFRACAMSGVRDGIVVADRSTPCL